MFKRIYILMIALSCGLKAFAQPTVGGIVGKAYDMNTAIGGFISQVDHTNYDPIGEVYLLNEWASGIVTLNNDQPVGNLVMKLNLLNNVIDVKDGERIKTFSMDKVKTVQINSLLDSFVVYHNPKICPFYEHYPKTGVIRIVVEGDWSLLERNYVKVFESNYVQAFDAGTKQDRYSVEKEYFLEMDGSLYSTDGGRGKFVKSLNLGKNSGVLEHWMKTSKLSNKDLNDLKKIASYLNENH